MNKFLSIIILASLLLSNGCQKQREKSKTGAPSGTISLSGAFALYPMAIKWKEEYTKKYPDVRIDISAGGAGKGMADALSGIVDLGMVSREITQVEIDRGIWYLPLVKDAVIAVVNEENPVIGDLMQSGLTRDMLVKIFITGEVKTWGEAVGKPSKSGKPIQIFTRSDACGAADVWAKFLGKKQEDLKGVGVFGDPGIAQAVQNDLNSIGYNNLGFAFNPLTKKINKGLKALPIDLNANSVIDSSENFYYSQASLVKAIEGDVYPSPPARDLYIVAKGKPKSGLVKHFLNWILTEGQKYVPENGYINLSDDKIKLALDKIK